MRNVYVVQYWEEDTSFSWQIYTVTTSEEYVKDCARMLSEKDGIIQAGYEIHNLVELEVVFEEN